MVEPMNKTYRGSCHCGDVRFECDLDLAAVTSRCNCSMCGKQRFWKAIAKPDAFRLLAGEEGLSDYQFGNKIIHHRFCRRCGIRSFAQGHHEALGGTFYAINVACLDEVTPEELARANVIYEDGRHGIYDAPPPVTSYL
jgi:hypothetical protein